jgi:hypothetical protein
VKVPSQAASPEDFDWHNTPWEVLMAISARLHRHPMPTWYLAKLAGYIRPPNSCPPDRPPPLIMEDEGSPTTRPPLR